MHVPGRYWGPQNWHEFLEGCRQIMDYQKYLWNETWHRQPKTSLKTKNGVLHCTKTSGTLLPTLQGLCSANIHCLFEFVFSCYVHLLFYFNVTFLAKCLFSISCSFTDYVIDEELVAKARTLLNFIACRECFSHIPVFTTRRYASAVLAVIVCPSVRPSVRLSVRLSQVGVVQRWLNLGSD